MNSKFLTTIRNTRFFQYLNRLKRPSDAKEWMQLIGVLTGIFIVLSFIMVFTLYQSVRLGGFGELPDKTTLQNINNSVASEVYSVDNQLLGRYYIKNRTNIEFDEVGKDMVNALVSVEDERFYQHSGIDNRSLFRVLFKSILLQNDNTGGGSTISQQLAKNLFPRKNHGLLTMPVNKCREMIIAKRLERIYNKKEILTLYLNTVPFGEDVYGIGVAAQRFFNTTAKDLTINQAAVLAGMLQSPTAYNPRLHEKRALFRRNIVLKQMLKNKFITKKEYTELKEQPLGLNYQYISHSDGPAPYFRAHLREELKNFCSHFKKEDGTPYNIYRWSENPKRLSILKWQKDTPKKPSMNI